MDRQHDRDELLRVVQSAMPGWEFLSEPRGFGWARDRHFRAQLTRKNRKTSVVIRRARSRDDFQVECFVYRSLLPHLSIRTPRLWGVFAADIREPGWMVLEDLGSGWIREDCREDREGFLRVLGCLHGEGVGLLRDKRLTDSPLPQHMGLGSEYQEWRTLLVENMADPFFGLEEWMLYLVDALRLQLPRQPMTLLHGDVSYVNALRVPFEIALIDWEAACIGPMSLDLGMLMEIVESMDELRSYRRALGRATGKEWSMDQIRLWADLGEGHKLLEWVCSYIEGTKQGPLPKPDWHQQHYEPRLGRLCRLQQRRADWCTPQTP